MNFVIFFFFLKKEIQENTSQTDKGKIIYIQIFIKIMISRKILPQYFVRFNSEVIVQIKKE